MAVYETIQDSLSFHGIVCNKPYYISSGNPILSYPREPFRISYYSIFIGVSGAIDIEIENRKLSFTENDLIVASPTTVIKLLSATKDFRVKLLFFEKEFLLKSVSTPFVIEKMGLFIKNSFNSMTLSTTDRESILNLLHYLEQKQQNNGVFTSDIIRTIIFNILLEIAELVNTGTQVIPLQQFKTEDIYFRFIALVRQNVMEHKNVQYYADRLFITNKYLIKIVHKACGKTPRQVIDDYLMKEAYVLLNNSTFNISAIADKLNFSSTSSFSRFFRKLASVSPSEYRAKRDFNP